MCELLALCFNKPVRASLSFSALLEGTGNNPHGWGIGFHSEDNAATVFKDSLPGDSSELARFVEGFPGVKSRNFVGHIRKASRGKISLANTHPFSRHYGKTEIVFAHNGTIRERFVYPPYEFLPIGETDSEAAFCHLLWKMTEKRIYPCKRGNSFTYSLQQMEEIYKILKTINKHGKFNCIFSDGLSLFAYRGIDSNTLYFIERKYPFPTCRFRDSDIDIELNLSKEKDEFGFVVATIPLSEEPWKPFEPGQLIVFQAGKVAATLT